MYAPPPYAKILDFAKSFDPTLGVTRDVLVSRLFDLQTRGAIHGKKVCVEGHLHLVGQGIRG